MNITLAESERRMPIAYTRMLQSGPRLPRSHLLRVTVFMRIRATKRKDESENADGTTLATPCHEVRSKFPSLVVKKSSFIRVHISKSFAAGK